MSNNPEMSDEEKDVANLFATITLHKLEVIKSIEFQNKLKDFKGKIGKSLEKPAACKMIARNGGTKVFKEVYKILEENISVKVEGGVDIDFVKLFDSPDWKELFQVYWSFLYWLWSLTSDCEEMCKDFVQNDGIELACDVLKKKDVFDYTKDDKKTVFKIPNAHMGMLINVLQNVNEIFSVGERLRNLNIIGILNPYLNSSYVIS